MAWLERHLHEYPGTVIAVTHDRYFLDNVAGWILELDRGHGIPWRGNYSSWLEQKQQRLAQEEKQASQRQKTLERELEWLHMSPKAQATKRKRASTPTTICSPRRERAREDREIYIPPGPRLGDVVIAAEGEQGVRRQAALRRYDLRIPPGRHRGHHRRQRRRQDHAIPLIVGQEKPDDGDGDVGQTVSWPMSTRAGIP